MALEQFQVGQSVTAFDFGDVQNGDTNAGMEAFLEGLTYGQEGYVILLSATAGEATATLRARKVGENNYALYAYMGDVGAPLYENGYTGLTDGKFAFGATATVETVNDTTPPTWNGIFIGAVTDDAPVDTVKAGTYSVATGIWTDNADYVVTDNGDGTYGVTGLIPYGRADSMFPFAGYRFAVKISRSTITSRDDLPDGTIVKITVGSEVTQATKSNFEEDGSLIYIAAPTQETLTTPRVVQIAWSIEGSTVQESDFTSYTFDLSEAELAPIPEENEEESRVAYCLTPNLQSTKIVKVVAPSGGLRAGQVVNCVSLASTVEGIANNLEVYSPSLPTTATLGSNFYALITNGGFEQLEDGRRPEGNPDYTTYVYNEGDICDAILLDKNLVFEISGSCISGDTSLNPVADIGRYIVPTNGTYVLSIANAPTAGGCLKIIGTSYFKKGGLFNNAYTSTYIALAIH